PRSAGHHWSATDHRHHQSAQRKDQRKPDPKVTEHVAKRALRVAHGICGGHQFAHSRSSRPESPREPFEELMRATLTVLGSGTSMGVPTIGCDCKVCTSQDARDRRTRPSVLIQFGGYSVLIDSTPDFREQALRENIKRLDAVLYTHAHADHILGLDDLRPLTFKR